MLIPVLFWLGLGFGFGFGFGFTIWVKGSRSKAQGQRLQVKGQMPKVKSSRSKAQGQRLKAKGQRPKVKGSRPKVKGPRPKVKGSRSKAQGQRLKVKGSRLSDKLSMTSHDFLCVVFPVTKPVTKNTKKHRLILCTPNQRLKKAAMSFINIAMYMPNRKRCHEDKFLWLGLSLLGFDQRFAYLCFAWHCFPWLERERERLRERDTER